MLLFPVVLYIKARLPKAALSVPTVFDDKALYPTAVFLTPVVLFNKALAPTLVLVTILPPPLPTLTLPFTSKSPLDC